MRKLALLFILLVPIAADAGRLTNEDREFCTALSSHAWNILMNRFDLGMSIEQQRDAIGPVNADLGEAINKVITVVYREDFPIPRSAADIAMYTTDIRDQCLDMRKDD